MTRDEAVRYVESLDLAIRELEMRRDLVADEFIRCETCGGKMSGPPCYGIKPTQESEGA